MSGPAPLELTPAEKRMIDARKQAIHDAKAMAIANGNPHAAEGGLPLDDLDRVLDRVLDPTSQAARQRKEAREAAKEASPKPKLPPPALRSLLAWVTEHPGPADPEVVAQALGVTPKVARARWDWACKAGFIPLHERMLNRKPGRKMPAPKINPNAPRPSKAKPLVPSSVEMTADTPEPTEDAPVVLGPSPLQPTVDQVVAELDPWQPLTVEPSAVAAVHAAPNKFDLALRVLGQLTHADRQTAVEVLDFARRAVELMRPS